MAWLQAFPKSYATVLTTKGLHQRQLQGYRGSQLQDDGRLEGPSRPNASALCVAVSEAWRTLGHRQQQGARWAWPAQQQRLRKRRGAQVPVAVSARKVYRAITRRPRSPRSRTGRRAARPRLPGLGHAVSRLGRCAWRACAMAAAACISKVESRGDASCHSHFRRGWSGARRGPCRVLGGWRGYYLKILAQAAAAFLPGLTLPSSAAVGNTQPSGPPCVPVR